MPEDQPKFVERVSHLPLVESSFKTATDKYETMKGMAPQPITYAMGMAESAASLALTTAEGVAKRFPTPVKYVDDLACSALDKVEAQSKRIHDILTTFPSCILTTEQLTNLTITDEQKKYYLELFQLIQNGRVILTEKVSFEMEWIQKRLHEATTELYTRLQEILSDLEKESPQGEIARLPKPVIAILRQAVRTMNDILSRMSALKLKSQGELKRIYSYAHQLLTDIKDRTTLLAQDGTVRISELSQYVEKMKFVRDLLSLLQRFAPLAKLLPGSMKEQRTPGKQVNCELKPIKNGKRPAESDGENNKLNGSSHQADKYQILEEDESMEDDDENSASIVYAQDTSQEDESTLDQSSADSSYEQERQF